MAVIEEIGVWQKIVDAIATFLIETLHLVQRLAEHLQNL